MRKCLLRIVISAALLMSILFVVAFNAINLNEAYGDGPPYYSRTTNMDKWTSPLPFLGVIDGAMLVAIGAYCLWIRRSR
ncbi:hypothetical protein ACN9MG_25260 [Burkholderia ambifaria]|jgi:hypothetical protein|uniref:hypothetical protein n=1 Tax=Burkholderia TaxID=32008 RepID=UPI00158F3F19|nr:hypothetical protein [Burkholderia ambifaria]